MRVLALEASTSSAKAMVYDDALGAVRLINEEYGDFAANGMQDAQAVHEAVLRVGRAAAQGQTIEAVSLSAVWHNIGLMRSDGRMDGPIYIWSFLGGAGDSARVRQDVALTDQLYCRTGCMPHAIYPRHTLAWLRAQGATFAGKRLITQGGYSFWKLTGEMRESLSTLSGTGLMDIHSLRFDGQCLAELGLSEAQFGACGRYRDTAPLLPEAARALGVRAGIPVVPAHPDGALNQIGSGAARPGRMTLSVGTSGAIRLSTERPALSPGHETWCNYGVDSYISGAAVAGACNCVNWYRRVLLGGSKSFDALESGCLALPEKLPIFLPFLFGERCPGWRDDRRGGFVELEAGDDASTMYLGLQAGVLFSLYQCYLALARLCAQPEGIVCSGGILHSCRWTQMIADIFGRTVLCQRENEASLLGASALALCACGALDHPGSFTSAYDSAYPVAPDPAHVNYYRAQYPRYLEAYRRN